MPIFDYHPGKGPLYGTLGGSTFSRSRFGSVARSGLSPSRNPTNRRGDRLQALQSSMGRWNGVLSPAQKAAWNALGAATVWTDPVGETYSPNGANLYLRTNSLRYFFGLSPVDLAPAQAKAIAFGIAYGWDAANSQLLVSASPSMHSDYRVFFDVSIPFSVSRYFHRSPYAFNDSVLGAPAKSDAPVLPSGLFAESDRISIRSRQMAPDGSLSDPAYSVFTCEALPMIVLQTQLNSFTFSNANQLEWMFDGQVQLRREGTGAQATFLFPVNARLRHISVKTYTSTVVSTPPNVELLYYNGSSIARTFEILGSNAAGANVWIADVDITGELVTALQGLSTRLRCLCGVGESLSVERCLAELWFEIGDFS